MVAVIKNSKSLRNVLHYNENKLQNKAAKLIHSEEFAKDTSLLNLMDKLRTFEKRNSLNKNVKLNTVHISLNFHQADKLSDDKMSAIACDYMKRIGFDGQPFLVYRHFDAGHEHLHIISTTIRADGSNIRMFNIGRNQSTIARKAIEKDFGLRPASTAALKRAHEIKPVSAQKVQYGKTETKRAITNVLDHVLINYKFSSIAELNAVLQLYNVMADMGTKDSRIAKNAGLVYRVLDKKGQKVGMPIKASLIYNKPTLKFLQQKFIANTPLKYKHKFHLKNSIDFILKQNVEKISMVILINTLKQQGIDTILRQNNAGRIYGLTYVDHITKCIFNGGSLGKPYAANGLLQRLAQTVSSTNNQKIAKQQKILTDMPFKLSDTPIAPINAAANWSLAEIIKDSFITIMGILTQEEYTGSLALDLQTERRKRKRKRPRAE